MEISNNHHNSFPSMKQKKTDLNTSSTKSQASDSLSKTKDLIVDCETPNIDYTKEQLGDVLFGEDSEDEIQRIRNQSPFKRFLTWKLTHLIIKTGDNLK